MKRRTRNITFFIVGMLGLLTTVTCCKHEDSLARAPAYATAATAGAPSPQACDQRGIASWYGTHMKGRQTASGEAYDPQALTAASKRYPFGTELHVTNLKNDRSVTVTVNDRGPYVGKRVIDMSVAAANKLGMKDVGLAPVCIQVAKEATPSDAKTS
jgi:rare lipoprotein A (peptidoglycan hydrolase)